MRILTSAMGNAVSSLSVSWRCSRSTTETNVYVPKAPRHVAAPSSSKNDTCTNIDAACFTPGHALSVLEEHIQAGARYPQLRPVVRNWLTEVQEPSVFVAECAGLLFDRLTGKHSSYQIDGRHEDLLVCLYVMLECLSRLPRVCPGFKRKRFDETVTRGAVTDGLGRKLAGKIAQSLITSEHDVPGRAVVRLIETYGLEMEDLSFYNADEALEAIERYVEVLMERGAHGPAMSLVFHFSLDNFATEETLQSLINAHEYTLAQEFSRLRPALRRTTIELCIAQGEREHAGLRQAYKTTVEFELEDEYPKTRLAYYMSTIRRMIVKGQYEAALKRAGSEEELQEWVIRSLTEIGELGYAAEYAARCGLEYVCDQEELERALMERKETYLQLPDDLLECVAFCDDEKSLMQAYERFISGENIVGIDTEWSTVLDEEISHVETNDVATLQIGTKAGVCILDVPKLVEVCPEILEATIGKIFKDKDVTILGFAVHEDLRKLAKTHSLFQQVTSTCDLQQVWKLAVANARKSGQDNSAPWSTEIELNRAQPVGLSTVVAAVLGKPLDKAMRMSDWAKRPLSQSQIIYAALDAWTLVEVHRVLLTSHNDLYTRLVGKAGKVYNFKK